MKINGLIAILALFAFSNLHAQTKIMELQSEQYFDFWIGNWDLTWESTAGKGTGENDIVKILNNKVIKENFKVINDSNMQGYIGESWSVYNKNSNHWNQTWVDNQGAYLDFVGEFDGNKRIFKRTATKADGSTILQRMVFYDIEKDSFTWDWENSTDNGKTWKLQWRIYYKRKGASQ